MPDIGITGAIARAYNSAANAEFVQQLLGKAQVRANDNEETLMAGQATREHQDKHGKAASRRAGRIERGPIANPSLNGHGRNPCYLLPGTEEFMEIAEQPMGIFQATEEDSDKVGTGGDSTDAAIAGHLAADGPVFNPKHELRQLRRKMLAGRDEGEVGEYLDAEFANDIVEVVDGLIDTIVIAWGSLLTYIGPEAAIACANEVAISNLDKFPYGPVEDGEDAYAPQVIRREDGKIMKPEGWQSPRIAEILEAHGIVRPPVDGTDPVVAIEITEARDSAADKGQEND